MISHKLTRRNLLGAFASGSAVLVLAPILSGCSSAATTPTAAPAATPASAPTAQPTTAASKPTVAAQPTTAASPVANPTAAATPVASSKVVKLTNVEDDSRPLDNQAYANVYKAFQAKYPNIQIDFQILPWEQAEAKERTMAQANNLPDMGRAAYAPDLVKLNGMVPLDDLVKPAYLDRYPKSWIPTLYLNGPDNKQHLYAISSFAGDKAILVNKTYFDKAGIKLPDTWTTTQFADYAKQLTTKGKVWGVSLDAAGVGDPWQNFWLCVRAFGGGLIKGNTLDSKTPEAITINSKEFAAGATWWRDLYKNGWAVPSAPTDTYQQRDSNFMSGKAAIMWQGPWSLIAQSDALKQQGWEMAAMPLPQGPAGNSQGPSLAGTYGIFSTAQTHGVVDEAFSWISFLCSDQGETIYCSTNGMLPSSQALWKLPQFGGNPLYSGYIKGFSGGSPDYPIWATSAGVSTIFDQKGVPMMQGLLLNQLTPEQMAQQLQTEVVNFLTNNGLKLPSA